MNEINLVSRQRWSALWNGVVIGLGVFGLMRGELFGILPLVVGIGIEVMQRKWLKKRL